MNYGNSPITSESIVKSSRRAKDMVKKWTLVFANEYARHFGFGFSNGIAAPVSITIPFCWRCLDARCPERTAGQRFRYVIFSICLNMFGFFIDPDWKPPATHIIESNFIF